MSYPRSPSRSITAFSLIEVTIAIGITSFGVLALLGLMPVGLSTMGEASRQMKETQVIQQISSDLALLPFTQVDSYASSGPVYADGNGTIQSGKDNETRLEAQLTPITTRFPGSERSSFLPQSVRTVKIEVREVPGAADQTPSTYVINVANSGN